MELMDGANETWEGREVKAEQFGGCEGVAEFQLINLTMKTCEQNTPI